MFMKYLTIPSTTRRVSHPSSTLSGSCLPSGQLHFMAMVRIMKNNIPKIKIESTFSLMKVKGPSKNSYRNKQEHMKYSKRINP